MKKLIFNGKNWTNIFRAAVIIIGIVIIILLSNIYFMNKKASKEREELRNQIEDVKSNTEPQPTDNRKQRPKTKAEAERGW
jgi:hypothetical protein